MSQAITKPWRAGRSDMQSYDGYTGEPFTNIYVDDERGGVDLVTGQRLPLVVARVLGEDNKEFAARIVRAVNNFDALREMLRGAVLSVEWRADVMHGEHGLNPDAEAHAALTKFAQKCRTLLAEAENNDRP